MTHTSTEQAEVRDLAYWIAHTTDNPTAALIQSLHARVQELEAQTAHMADLVELADYATKKLEASQAQRVPLISDSSKVISDEELERAFAGTNFGTKDYRSVLHTAVLKKACGYYCGHTITQIMKDLRLIGAKGSPIKRGIEFLRASYHQQMVNGA